MAGINHAATNTITIAIARFRTVNRLTVVINIFINAIALVIAMLLATYSPRTP